MIGAHSHVWAPAEREDHCNRHGEYGTSFDPTPCPRCLKRLEGSAQQCDHGKRTASRCKQTARLIFRAVWEPDCLCYTRTITDGFWCDDHAPQDATQ